MKNRALVLALIAGLAGATGAYAQAPAADGPDALFSKLDSNHDGQLDQSELGQLHQVMQQQRFDRADSNQDGKIEKSEFMAQAAQRADHMFGHIDKNSDGAIETSEMTPPAGKSNHVAYRHHHRHASPQAMLKKMDSNGDGAVSQDEWDAAVAQWHHHSHGPDSTDQNSGSASAS